ncbi:MAG: hypothetical protein AAF389_14800 [Gemmatimonadota bacterium]
MPRIRTIKPEFWSDEKLGPLEPLTRLVFLGLVSHADDAGRLVDSVRQLDGLLFPYSEDSSRDSLETLARLSRIVRYQSDSGQRLIQIVGWTKHQRVDKPSKHVLPAPTSESVVDQQDPEPSRDTPETLASVSRDPRAPTMDLGASTPDLGPKTTALAAPESGDVNQGELLDLADRVLGLNRLSGLEKQANRRILGLWLYSGDLKRDPFEIMLAIEGAAEMRDLDRIGWDSAKPGTPMTLKALNGPMTLADQGDGKAQRDLYAVAVEFARSKTDDNPVPAQARRRGVGGMKRALVALPEAS